MANVGACCVREEQEEEESGGEEDLKGGHRQSDWKMLHGIRLFKQREIICPVKAELKKSTFIKA